LPSWETEPWKTIAEKNNPGATRTNAPILIIQGDADPIVAPDVTARLADELCAEGETVDLRLLTGTAHVDAGHVAVPDVVQWIADRFAGKPAPTTF
jgi:dipeptidyl aminopeptidase/acylaminoacyl peptidase